MGGFRASAGSSSARLLDVLDPDIGDNGKTVTGFSIVEDANLRAEGSPP